MLSHLALFLVRVFRIRSGTVGSGRGDVAVKIIFSATGSATTVYERTFGKRLNRVDFVKLLVDYTLFWSADRFRLNIQEWRGSLQQHSPAHDQLNTSVTVVLHSYQDADGADELKARLDDISEDFFGIRPVCEIVLIIVMSQQPPAGTGCCATRSSKCSCCRRSATRNRSSSASTSGSMSGCRTSGPSWTCWKHLALTWRHSKIGPRSWKWEFLKF